MEFKCVSERKLEHGPERIYEADFSSICDCDQPLIITFRAREYPEGIFSYHGCHSADAEIIVQPNIREHSGVYA